MARRRRRLSSRLRGYLRALLAFLFGNIGITVLVTGYTVAGAFIFQAIEGGSELELFRNMTQERSRLANYLWHNVTLTLNVFNDTEMKFRIGHEIDKYQRTVVSAVRHGWDGGRTRQWSFSSTFLYSMTVISTIGYGNLSPRTMWGKLVTIVYALLGMPLFLLYLSNVGELLAGWFKCLYALVCLCRGCPGVSRRRIIKLKNQFAAELSEAESIERPEGWRRYSDSPDVASYRHPDTQRRPNYRSYSTPHAATSREDYPEQNISNRYQLENERNPYAERPISIRDPRHFDPRFSRNNYYDPRGLRGHSEPVCSASELSSEFTYVTFDSQTITVPISICVAVMVGYILFGAMLFGNWEKWNELDGAYFCFISLSSIGFGDFVPGERVYSQKIETSFIACSIYLMLGTALVAMCFNLMQEQVIHYFAAMKRALRRICNCKR